jgi:hypothetical protein
MDSAGGGRIGVEREREQFVPDYGGEGAPGNNEKVRGFLQ